MEPIKLYKNGNPIEELNKFEQLAFDIIKSAISKNGFDLTNELSTKQFENWGRWLRIIKLQVSVKRLNILSRNLRFKKLCFSEDKKIFANMEFALFKPRWGNEVGIVELNIFQVNPESKSVVREN